MPSIFKKKQFWGALVAIAILVFLFHDFNFRRMGELAKELEFVYLIPAFLLATLMIVFKTWRWVKIVGKARKVRFFPTLSMYSTSVLINIMLPALTGQAARVILFSKQGKFSKTFAFSTIFLEVVLNGTGLIILMMLSSMLWVFPSEYQSVSYIIGAATLAIFILFYLSLTFQKRIEDFASRRIRPRSARVYMAVRKTIRSFNQGLSVLKRTDKLAFVLGITLLTWAAEIGVVYSLFHVFGFDLPLLPAVVILIINHLAIMIPITPGNVGPFQLAIVAGLNLFAIRKTEAVLFSVVLYLIDMLPIVILSWYHLFKENFSILQLGEDEEVLQEVKKMVSDEDDVLIDQEETRT